MGNKILQCAHQLKPGLPGLFLRNKKVLILVTDIFRLIFVRPVFKIQSMQSL